MPPPRFVNRGLTVKGFFRGQFVKDNKSQHRPLNRRPPCIIVLLQMQLHALPANHFIGWSFPVILKAQDKPQLLHAKRNRNRLNRRR